MEIEEILKALAHTDKKFPKAALEQAIARKDEITPHLLQVLEEVAESPEGVLETGEAAYLYAMYLLAQFRESRAYPFIVKIASYPKEIVDDLLNDTITEGLAEILASVAHGDTSLIESLVENPQAEEFVRSAALESLLILVAQEEKTRDEVMDYYKSLFQVKLEKEPSFVWSSLVDYATALYPEEVYEDIKKAFADELADEWVLDLDWVDRQMALGKEALLAKLQEKHFIEDTIEEMEGWDWYHEPSERPKEKFDLKKFLPALNPQANYAKLDEPQTPYKAPKKVGRNEPCPCGSGKKYKKCCGAG